MKTNTPFLIMQHGGSGGSGGESFRHFRHSATCCFYTLCTVSTVFRFQKGYRTLTEGSREEELCMEFLSLLQIHYREQHFIDFCIPKKVDSVPEKVD